MRKILLTVLATISMISTANANWYAEGNLGYGKLKNDDVSKSRVMPNVVVGYDFGDMRVAADYQYYGKAESGASSLKAQGVGVSAIYNVPLQSDIKPYVGARVSVNDIDARSVHTNGNTRTIRETDGYKMGYGAVAGVQYKLNHDWSINGGVEYNRLGKANDSSVKQYGAKAGMRYDF